MCVAVSHMESSRRPSIRGGSSVRLTTALGRPGRAVGDTGRHAKEVANPLKATVDQPVSIAPPTAHDGQAGVLQVARDRLDNAGANPIIGGPLTEVGKRADRHRGGWLRRRGDRDDQARPDDHRDCGPDAVANAWGVRSGSRCNMNLTRRSHGATTWPAPDAG